MTLKKVRSCPMCGGDSQGTAFPYVTQFNDINFGYFSCSSCSTVYVDPVPDGKTFAKMYAKSGYHDQHYDNEDTAQYRESVQLLSRYLESNSRILDYGCGVGNFLKASKSHGFIPFGVEFDGDAALFAAKNAVCEAISLEAFESIPSPPIFDAIHLGDVLEHLADPLKTLTDLLNYLKPGGILFVEGPLENNPSLVFWGARCVGAAKRIFKHSHLSKNAPTHLLRTDAKAQRAFFSLLSQDLVLRHWSVYESGWPYASGGLLKRTVAALAKLLGGREIFGLTFGNRFAVVLVKP